VRPTPDFDTGFTQHLLHHFGRNLAECGNGIYPHREEQLLCFGPYHRNLPYGHRIQERLYPFARHLPLAIGFCRARGNLRDRLIYRKPHRERQTGFVPDPFPQFAGPLQGTHKTIHSRQIEVVLIDRGLFVHRGLFGNDIGNRAGIATVEIHIAPYHPGLRTKPERHPHGHGRVYPENAGFITACSHHTPVGEAADNHGKPFETTVAQPLDRDKECVHIEQHNRTGVLRKKHMVTIWYYEK